MKKPILLIVLALALSLCTVQFLKAATTGSDTFQTAEFATIRWDGREKSHVIRPNGRIEPLRELFERYPRPNGTDERLYYLTIAMNALAQEGFEFAGTLHDHLVVKRRVD